MSICSWQDICRPYRSLTQDSHLVVTIAKSRSVSVPSRCKEECGRHRNGHCWLKTNNRNRHLGGSEWLANMGKIRFIFSFVYVEVGFPISLNWAFCFWSLDGFLEPRKGKRGRPQGEWSPGLSLDGSSYGKSYHALIPTWLRYHHPVPLQHVASPTPPEHSARGIVPPASLLVSPHWLVSSMRAEAMLWSAHQFFPGA